MVRRYEHAWCDPGSTLGLLIEDLKVDANYKRQGLTLPFVYLKKWISCGKANI